MMEDTRIIEMFFERDQQAIQELDTKYGKVCHKLSYNIVNNRYDAEECVNDAYLDGYVPQQSRCLLSIDLFSVSHRRYHLRNAY